MTTKDDKTGFEDLLRACHDIAEMFPEGVVFIGGIAGLDAAQAEMITVNSKKNGIIRDIVIFLSINI